MAKNRLKVARKPITGIDHGRKRLLIRFLHHFGTGVYLTQVVIEAGLSFVVAKTWRGGRCKKKSTEAGPFRCSLMPNLQR